MYPTVPRIVPGSVASAAVQLPDSDAERNGSVFARPKSRSFTNPSSVMKMFAGFRSRCTRPLRWAEARPSATETATSSALLQDGCWVAANRSNGSPWRSSMTAKTRPFCRPTSYRATTFGCDRAATVRASRSKRARAFASSIRRGEITLTATSRASRVSIAR
jgi:hypothetical protein